MKGMMNRQILLSILISVLILILTSAKISNATPAQMDWRELGLVTPVKNQGQCGSSWAFAAVAAVESQIMINEYQRGGEFLPMDLSEQQLVSCSEPTPVPVTEEIFPPR